MQILFKKHAINSKELDFESFKFLLEKVAIQLFSDEKSNMSDIDKVEKIY